MTTIHSLFRSLAQRVPIWLDRLLSGLTRSIELNRHWIRVYVVLLVLVGFLHPVLTRQSLPSPAGGTVVAMTALVLVWPVLNWGREQHFRNRRRTFSRALIVVATFGSLVAATIPLLPLTGLLRASMGMAVFAWAAAALLILLILLFPATAFNPDFAHLGMFRRYSLVLELASGLLLFVVAAQQLLLWPELIPHGRPMLPGNFFVWLASPSVPNQVLPEILLNAFAIGLTLAILALAVLGLYLQLAHRWYGSNFRQTLRESIRLLRENLWHRFAGLGKQIWPNTPRQGHLRQMGRSKDSLLLEDFMLVSTLAAVSLAFGLWVPQAVPQGSGPGLSGLSASNGLALLVLVLFLAGGIDIWLRTIEVAGVKGCSYALGLWLGTLALYWPTTLLTVLVVTDVVNFSTLILLQPDALADFQNAFTLWYRGALGAITLIIALAQSRQFSQDSVFWRTLRYGLAAIAALVLLSFVIHTFGQIPGIAAAVPWVALVAVVGGALVLFYAPQRRRRGPDVGPLGAQLIASSSLAVVPLLFSRRIAAAQWSENGYADLTIRGVGMAPQALQLRTYIMGSEDEVAFEATNEAHARLRGPIDFVLTDLRTAIKIMGTCHHQGGRHHPQYRILCVVATLPWQHVAVSDDGEEHVLPDMSLDAGYLRFSPPFRSPEVHTAQSRPASLATVAYYAANHRGDVGEVYLTEPYYSWLARQFGIRERVVKCAEAERQVVYVLLARYHEHTVPAVPYNWRRTICEMVVEGQQAAEESQCVINHDQLHTVHAFLQEAIDPRVTLHLEDLHLALCRSRFEPLFSADAVDEYRLAIHDLHYNGFIARNVMRDLQSTLEQEQDAEAVVLRAVRSANPPIIYEGASLDEDFFHRFYCYRASPWPDHEDAAASYLHSLALVSLPDRPGELARLLERDRKKLDLAMVATTNLGDSALVYLLNRQGLPSRGRLRNSLGKPLPREFKSVQWIRRLQKRGFDAIEVRAFMVALQHRAGGLLEAVKGLRGTGEPGINLEQVFAFPVDEDLAVALLVTSCATWSAMYQRLTIGGPPPRKQETGEPLERFADEVNLAHGFARNRHEQQAVFRIAVEPGTTLAFECCGLPTWTPTWGRIDGWVAEVGFEEVRLKIPTVLTWQIAALGWVRRIPGVGKFLERRLGLRVPGLAGREAYKDPHRWKITLEPKH